MAETGYSHMVKGTVGRQVRSGVFRIGVSALKCDRVVSD